MGEDAQMDSDILDRTLAGPQAIASGITFEWVNEGRIIVLKLATVARDALDTYAEEYIRLLNVSTKAQHFLAIVDTTSSDVSFTPYVRQKINEMEAAVASDMPGRLALLMQDSVKSQVFKLIMRAFNMPQRRKKLERKVFVNYEEAMTWLEAGLPGEQGSS